MPFFPVKWIFRCEEVPVAKFSWRFVNSTYLAELMGSIIAYMGSSGTICRYIALITLWLVYWNLNTVWIGHLKFHAKNFLKWKEEAKLFILSLVFAATYNSETFWSFKFFLPSIFSFWRPLSDLRFMENVINCPKLELGVMFQNILQKNEFEDTNHNINHKNCSFSGNHG